MVNSLLRPLRRWPAVEAAVTRLAGHFTTWPVDEFARFVRAPVGSQLAAGEPVHPPAAEAHRPAPPMSIAPATFELRFMKLHSEGRFDDMWEMLAEDAQRMVRESLDAFVRGDGNLAREVIAMDDSVDQQTEQSFRELLTYMLEDPRNISRAIRLAFIGKYFERMADGATNVCEMVVYLVEGKMIKHATGLLHNG